jgi:hypothetical protein
MATSMLEDKKFAEAFATFVDALQNHGYYLASFEIKKFADFPSEGTFFGVPFKVL